MTRYELFKLLHVIGAVMWIGGGAGLALLTIRLRAAGEREAILSIGRQAEAIGKGLFMPAALSTLVFGILMVATDPVLSFTDLWIVIGLAGVAASFVVGVVLLEPADKRLTALLTDRTLDDPEVGRELGRVLRLNGIDLAILLAVIWVMIAKPLL